ncbi:MAG: formylmethanofuran dehydrogenase subunit E family protein [Spirochaetes bacterium]|nr:formylmethanofuran dehydrogenase subunit E family protein [Spirochaetota bacterium]
MTTICGQGADEFMRMLEEFHGYRAPGVLIGGFMVDLALERRSGGGFFEVLCETRVCLPDAVQLLTPCTFGNGWLKLADVGRYALALFDKKSGAGIRVHVDTKKLAPYPGIREWFFKAKPKIEQDTDRLVREILDAGKSILTATSVQVAPEFLGPRKKGATSPCPSCGEGYPVENGDRCLACQGKKLYV